MEIIPGVGLPVARIGQTVRDIEAAVGPATVADPRSAAWLRHSPPFAAYFDEVGASQMIEVFSSHLRGEPVTFAGIQLIFRLMDEVEADLERSGLIGRRAGLVVDFDLGFTLWSLDETSACDLSPDAAFDPTDHRLVVEGVAIARRA